MDKKYLNPPLQEALCEFRFVPDGTWDETKIGLIYHDLQKGDLITFPKKQQIPTLNFNIDINETNVNHSIGTTSLSRFLAEDEKTLVQIAPYLLSVHRLRPYSGWIQLKPTILNSLEIYLKNNDQAVCQTVTLRYINQIHIESDLSELQRYFRFHSNVDIPSIQSFNSFINGIQISKHDDRDLLGIMLMTPQMINTNGTTVIFDLNYQLLKPDRMTSEEISDWIESAHEEIENVFEDGITDELRQSFQNEG